MMAVSYGAWRAGPDTHKGAVMIETWLFTHPDVWTSWVQFPDDDDALEDAP
jgi:hypothetical protein